MNSQFHWSQATTESPIFWLLIICSIITVGVALERTAYFWRRRGSPEGVMARVIASLRSGDSTQALWACRSTGHPVGRTALLTLETAEDPDTVAEERLFVTLSDEKLQLERNLAVLGTMAAVAPLIGLLGTVWGIMRAFHDMSLAGSAAPTIVAAGVAEALTTTAAGLVVAVPALLLYNHFARKMNVMLVVAENHARGLRAMLQGKDRGRANPAEFKAA